MERFHLKTLTEQDAKRLLWRGMIDPRFYINVVFESPVEFGGSGHCYIYGHMYQVIEMLDDRTANLRLVGLNHTPAVIPFLTHEDLLWLQFDRGEPTHTDLYQLD